MTIKLLTNLNCILIILFLIGPNFTFLTNSPNKNSMALNQYNNVNFVFGEKDLKLTNGTGYFDVYKDKNDRWWLVTPDGYAFYSVGINCVTPEGYNTYNANILKKYNDYCTWSNITAKRLNKWGFNTLGAWSRYEFFEKIPYTHQFIFSEGRHFKWTKYVDNNPDVFDPDWRNAVHEEIRKVTNELKNDPYLIGYWLDNEIHWGPERSDQNTLLENYFSVPYRIATSPYINYGKKEVVEFLIDRYNGNVKEFNRVWKMNIKYFYELYDETQLGRKGWTVFGRAKSDIDAFTRYVAETYFKNITATIKKYDQNHLILGARFHLYGVPREVVEVCGKYCDVISINFYRNNLLVDDPLLNIQGVLRRAVPLYDWGKKYNTITNKPIIISEFSYVTKNGEQSIGPDYPKSLMTQLGRAIYFRWYVINCVKKSYTIGYHWFAYLNKIKDGFEINYGLVDSSDEPYKVLVKIMSIVNNNAYKFHNRLA